MSDWLPSLNALRAFEAAARHLSYQEAAAELHVTPAAVKQLVGKLEEALGSPLLRRQGRGIALTEAGRAGLVELHGAFRQLRGAVEKMRRVERRRTLAITVEPSFAAAWLVKRLEAFKRANPEVDVLIDSSLRIVDLERDAVDVAIRYGGGHQRTHVVHRLFDDETLAVCSPAVAKGPPVLTALADLAGTTLIHLDIAQMPWITTSHHWFDWKNWLETVGAGDIAPARGLRFNDYGLMIQAAIAGQGVVLGSRPIVRDAMAAGLLVSPFPERARSDLGYDLVTTHEALAKEEVARFVEWILEERSEESDLRFGG